MNSQRIDIPLPNGFKLVAEGNTDPSYPYEIFVGICSNDNVWHQTLAVIRNAYHYDDGILAPVYDKNKYEILVFGNENDEDYTESFEIDHRRRN